MEWKPLGERIQAQRRKVTRQVIRLLETPPRRISVYRWGKVVFWKKALRSEKSISVFWDSVFPIVTWTIFLLLMITIFTKTDLFGVISPSTATDLLVGLVPLFSIIAARELWHARKDRDHIVLSQQGQPYLILDEDHQVTCYLVNDLYEFESFLVFDEGAHQEVTVVKPPASAKQDTRVVKTSLRYEEIAFSTLRRRDTWEACIRQFQVGALYLDELGTRYVVTLHGSKNGVSLPNANYAVLGGRVFLD